MKISLTREISNDDGYIDEIVDQIKSVPPGEELEMSTTTQGGNVFHGARLHRAVLEHQGHTRFVGIGLAASYGGVLMSAFDEIEFDEDLDIMLHKAHVPGSNVSELSKDERDTLVKFNQRAYAKLLASGDPKKFDARKEMLEAVFLAKETKDYWFTAKQLSEDYGIGHVTRIERRDGMPFKVAAKLKEKLNNKLDNMFGKKGITHAASLKDGRTVVFKNETGVVAKGDVLEVVGSSDVLSGSVELASGEILNMADGSKVESITEAPTVDPLVSDLSAKIESLENELKSMQAAKAKSEDEDEEEEMKKKKAAEATSNAMSELSAKVETLVGAFQSIKSDFKLPVVEDKHEAKQDDLGHLTASERHAYELTQVANGTNFKFK